MRLKALTLRYVLNIYIIGVGSLENILRSRKGLGLSFFRLGPLNLEALFQVEKAYFHIPLLKIYKNSWKVIFTVVLGLETS